jgi:hypothetical protein
MRGWADVALLVGCRSAADREKLGRATATGRQDATRQRISVPALGAELVETELVRQAARSRLEAPAFEAALAAGRDLSADQALREALDL